MKKPSPKAVDGFVPHSSRRTIGRSTSSSIGKSSENTTIDQVGESSRPLRTASLPQTVRRTDIDESLAGIDEESKLIPKKKKFLGIFPRKQKKALSRRKRIVKRSIKIAAALLLILLVFVGYKVFMNTSLIANGNLLGLFQSKPLEQDQYGRSNILVFGTSGSIDDTRHDGANLTDTVMVLSINQEKKNAYLVSLPRDLWVDFGGACNAGYQGKINELYNCHSEDGTKERQGADALRKKVQEVTGLELQYFAHINWAVVVEAINAVGGVDINVQGDGSCAAFGLPANSVVDNNMDINYKPGVHHMNGIQALKFSRARGSAGGCGLSRGDFDRQANQQTVIKALKEKAVSAGTATDITKVTGLLDALGKNLRTSFETSEIQTLTRLAKDIPSDKVTSIDLVAGDEPLITTAPINGVSAQQPALGLFEYSDIHKYLRKKLTDNAVIREDAHVAVFNGTTASGYAQGRADNLEEQGYTVTYVGNAPAGNYKNVELYDLSDNEKPSTRAQLETLYGVEARDTKSPIAVTEDTDFVIIYGKVDEDKTQ